MQAANKAPYLEMSRLGALAKLATSGNHIKRPKAASPSATTEEGQFLVLKWTHKLQNIDRGAQFQHLQVGTPLFVLSLKIAM